MKQVALLLCIAICVFQVEAKNKKSPQDYQQLSQSLAAEWLSNQTIDISEEQSCNILYTLILTHHLIQCSLDMTFYKLALQEESLHLYSPSINDSLHAPIKMKQNNFTEIYKTLRILEETQHKLQAAYKQMQIIGSLILALPATVTQTFINNIKMVLVAWSSEQKNSLKQFIHEVKSLDTIKKELSSVITHYKKMTTSKTLDHQSIKSFASTLSKGYHNIEKTFSSLILLNKERASSLKKIFSLAFKDHFTPLYNQLSQESKDLFLSEIDSLEIGLIDMTIIP